MATKTAAKKAKKAPKATKAAPKPGPGLLARLAKGPVLCAEGYLFEFERRGYLQAGAFVPVVVLEHPDLVEGLHRDFVHAGSDVVEAFTYYAHRAKLRMVGRERDLELINRTALRIAKKVARATGTLLAGNICNTSIYGADDQKSHEQARRIFDEQVGWADDAGVDFIVGETYSWGGEALLALEAIRRSGKPAVITLAVPREGRMREGWSVADAARRLEAAGADVVGLNCSRGPATMMPLLREMRSAVSCHVGALPVPYRTTPAEPTFQSLTDPSCACIPDNRPFPAALDPFLCNRYEIGEFGKDAYALGARYLGVCCGAGPHHMRGLAEGLGRRPPASRYSPDMSKHILFGTDKRLRQDNLKYGMTYRRDPGA
jgi:betaine-homocysteine S-methyltransferase